MDYASRSKKTPKNRPLSARQQQIMAKERKEAAIKCFRHVCDTTYAGAGPYVASKWVENSTDKLFT